MRQWMVDPKILCTKHLLGEHLEHHMFAGTLNKNISIKGYINNDLLEPLSLIKRHKELVKEMDNRGMKHKSELPIIDLEYLPKNFLQHKINKENSLKELLSRCSECEKNFNFKNNKEKT